MSIKVVNVTKLYRAQKALDQVSFEIQSGEIVGFLGPNGAGKSTMMKIIAGFIPQSSGDVLVNDLNINSDSLEVRKNIGYLPEHNPLYPEMYVKEYLEFVAGIFKLGKDKDTRIETIIKQTGLTLERKKKIGELSKGFKQRVGLAQALLHDPKVMILDEPTTGLDPNQIVDIRKLIRDVGKEKTVMLSTHIMQEVEAICDRVIIINNGKIVADDKAKNIISNTTEKYQTIVVEFSAAVESEKIEKIEGVSKVAQLKENNWLIQGNSDQDIRTSIFNFAVKNNLAVLSMQKKEKSLEEVFHELTKEN
jgi:ABC-2 type transport system ATP-binding protein